MFPPNADFDLGRYDVAIRYQAATDPADGDRTDRDRTDGHRTDGHRTDSARADGAQADSAPPNGNRLGGDWYEVRLETDGSAFVALGDVAGHGSRAAAGMVRIGGALRDLVGSRLPAHTLLDRLNRFVWADHHPERLASAVVCVLDKDQPGLCWAQAGHPPPVLVSHGVPRLLDRPQGQLLGSAPDAEYRLSRVQLAVGDTLFLYTDGLVEGRSRDIATGIMALLAAAQSCRAATAAEAATTVLNRLAPDPADDDICLIAIRVKPAPQPRAPLPTAAATGRGTSPVPAGLAPHPG